MIESIIETIMLGGAHEVLSRSPWLTMTDPKAAEKAAAAGGFLAYAGALEARSRAFAVIGVGLGAGAVLSALTHGVAS